MFPNILMTVAYAEGGQGGLPPMAQSEKMIGMVLHTQVSSEQHEYLNKVTVINAVIYFH